MKRGIYKICKCLVLTLLSFALSSNVFAYNLYYEASQEEIQEGNSKTTVLRFIQSAGASDTSKETWKTNDHNWSYKGKRYIKGNGSTTSTCASNDQHYFATALLIHSYDVLSTNYKADNADLGVGYLQGNYKKPITTETGEIKAGKNGITAKTAYISTNSQRNSTFRSQTLEFNISKVNYAWRVDTSSDTQYFIRQFSKSMVEDICTIFGLDNSKSNKIRFSILATTCGTKDYTHYGDSVVGIADLSYFYYLTQSGNYYESWLPKTKGTSVWGKTTATNDYQTYAKDSTVNEYDNVLMIPAINEANTQVYIKYVDTKGNTLNVSRGSQKLTNNGSTTDLKPTAKKDGYNEYYEISRGQSLKVDYKARYIQVGNKAYEFTSSKYGEYEGASKSDNNLSKAIKNMDDRGGDHQFTVKDNNKYKCAVIEYVYKEVPDTPVDYGPGNADAGKFNKLSLTGTITNGEKNISIKQVNESSTCNSGDKNEDKSVLYVPAGEKVNLKITSQKFFYKKLTQKPYVENGELKWKIVAEMYVLNPNSSRAKNSDDSGTTFFGNTRENVINANSPLSLGNTSGIDQESIVKDAKNYIKNSLKDYVGNTTRSISSLGQITMNSVGYGIAEEKNLTVNKDRYNGKRTVAGDSSYVEYTFTFEKDKDITTKKVNNSILTLNTNSTSINIYTPLDVSNVKIKSDSSTMVNHSDNKDATQIQKGSTFTINPKEKATFNYPGAGVIDTSKYAKGYILVFDFGVNDKAPGTQFEVGANDVFTGTVTGDINQANNSFKIMGITYNEPDNSNYNNSTGNAFKTEMESTDITTTTKTSGNTTITSSGIKYKYKEYIDNGSIGQIKVNQNACDKNIYTSLIPGVSVKEGAYYRVVHKVTTINIGRIYGFRVTDCSDVNWKNVFRNSSGDVVNSVTGTVYFSGKKVYDYLTNSMQSAKDARGATNILPLAPYKSTTTTYIQAPKLGYRISFDLKTSGYYDYVNAAANAQRKVTIQPSYYFINKDGSGYTSDIELYYKNKSGKYVRYENSGYSISFTPNDGYRHTFDDSNTSYKFNTDIMSDKLLTLNISKVYELYSGNGKDSRGMMAIDTANNDSVQVWFGEFKLPNSTIAIKKGGNVNQPLTDGYIGVKFDIKCIDEKSGITLDYNHENTAADKDSKTNTTQWDYDEYLGYTGIGKTFDQDIPLQLEKGTWHINSQDEWNKIKGTVILYDADNRAADDFE